MKLQKFPILAAAFLGAWLGFPADLGAFGGARASHGFTGGRSGLAGRPVFLGRPVVPARVFGGRSAFAGRSAFPARAVLRDARFSREFRRDRFNRGVSFVGGSPYFYGYPYGYPYPYGAYPAPSYDSGVAAGYPYGYAPASAACAEMLPPPVAEGVNGCPVPVAGDLVGNVQRALKYRGFYPGPIDGLSGPATRAAVRAYDASVGLPATGMIDARLLTSLGIL